MTMLDDWEGTMIATSCDHCGRYGMKYGDMIMPAWGTKTPMAAKLCSRYGRDFGEDMRGKLADPNCYILVSQGVEQLGERLDKEAEAYLAEDDPDDPPWAKWEGKEW